MVAGLPGGDPGSGHPDRLRRGAAAAVSPHPLGRHRDLELLERIHGRRRPLGRARRRRGPGHAVRRRTKAVALAVALVALACAALAAAESRWETHVLALIPRPGFPAKAYVAPNGRIYEFTYDNPNGDTVPSRVFEYTGSGT